MSTIMKLRIFIHVLLSQFKKKDFRTIFSEFLESDISETHKFAKEIFLYLEKEAEFPLEKVELIKANKMIITEKDGEYSVQTWPSTEGKPKIRSEGELWQHHQRLDFFFRIKGGKLIRYKLIEI